MNLKEIKHHVYNNHFFYKIDFLSTNKEYMRLETHFTFRDGDVIDLYLYIEGDDLFLSDLGTANMNYSCQGLNMPDIGMFTIRTSVDAVIWDAAQLIQEIIIKTRT